LHNNTIKGLQREDGCAGTGSGMKLIQKQWAVNHIEYMADRRLFKKCQRRYKEAKRKKGS